MPIGLASYTATADRTDTRARATLRVCSANTREIARARARRFHLTCVHAHDAYTHREYRALRTPGRPDPDYSFNRDYRVGRVGDDTELRIEIK